MNETKRFKHTAISVNMLWIFFFVLVPNLMVVAISLVERDPVSFFRWVPTLSNYRSLFDPITVKVFVNSVEYSTVTTILTLAVGYPFAWFLTRVSAHRRSLLLMMVMVPFWTSSLIRTYALVILMKANGVINSMLIALGMVEGPVSILYTDVAVYVGLVYSLLPFMILPLYAVLEKLDHGLIEAAHDLGANNFQTFMGVVLPLSIPGVMAGCIMVFLPSMGLFYIPDLLGGAKSMLVGNFIKNQFLTAGNWPFGSAASVFLIVAMIFMISIYLLIMKRFNRSVIL
ncbi:PotB2 [Desulforapulum autotrophicum HRM2]|uniref:PotB2 n=1 Tax=Desulforapulum autotrophicum (strain ATCC 43914 / DSM 3382 / VKM B-1955 / HRM2) TaxID=177437 RepID=C0Q8Z4_DESAH|nr:ABC transporter permease subunit [Desulforapulum autotrophicum]ACN14484.1 PotB2 [Desulforapulum autotrophicum HRM2]